MRLPIIELSLYYWFIKYRTCCLLGQGVHQLAQLRFLVGGLVGVDHAFFGGLVKFADTFTQQQSSVGGISGGDSGAEFLFNSFESAFTGAVAGVLLAAGAHPFDSGLQMSHNLLPFLLSSGRVFVTCLGTFFII